MKKFFFSLFVFLITFFAEEESEVVTGRVRPLEGRGFDGHAVTGIVGPIQHPVDIGVNPIPVMIQIKWGCKKMTSHSIHKE